jgi:hypothetical protein
MEKNVALDKEKPDKSLLHHHCVPAQKLGKPVAYFSLLSITLSSELGSLS